MRTLCLSQFGRYFRDFQWVKPQSNEVKMELGINLLIIETDWIDLFVVLWFTQWPKLEVFWFQYFNFYRLGCLFMQHQQTNAN